MAKPMADSIEKLVERAKEKSETFKAKEVAPGEEKGVHKVLEQEENNILVPEKTFAGLGVCDEICEAVKKMGYKHPSKIQAESLPYTLKDRDIIGLAETGSGKTAAFAIPVI